MIDAERNRVLEIRSEGKVASEVVADVLAMLDVEESMIDRASEERADLRAADTRRMTLGVACDHLDAAPTIVTSDAGYCARCIEDGESWVALRQCIACGNLACCDSSPGQHATEHFHNDTHPVMQSAEPGEDWRWCYVHHLTA